MLDSFLLDIKERRHLSKSQASCAMEILIQGQASEDQTKEFLLGLQSKGVTADEVAGLAHVMRAHALPVSTKRSDLVDVCGTGGDGAGTFNISTAVAFVVAGCGVGVAKHGNRSVSSNCGSSDVLEQLGINSNLSPSAVVEALETTGLGFFFAPTFHPALKRFSALRRALKIRTVFNLLGPLVNPAGVKKQVLGVFDKNLTPLMAKTLRELGSQEAMVLAAEDGLDEISIGANTQISHLKHGEITTYVVSPREAGIPMASLDALKGGSALENAQTILNILKGEKGPKRDVVLLNAAAALIVAGKAKHFKEGVQIAAEAIDKFQALEILLASQNFSKKGSTI